ncbi:MAG: class I SAM-dependent DNA methyltransferase [Planctomycetota bacterium]|nr:class I SAM-dependent DNA methyltransferase [Planctomycetota bacterium]
MASLSWNEVRDRAVAFSRSWAAATSEHADKQSFWNDFFAVFGRERRTVGSFEVAVKNIRGKYSFIDLLWTGVLLVEHKSAGKSFSVAESQAFEYIGDLLRENANNRLPRFVILSDFKRIAVYDLEPDEQANLPMFAGIHYDVTDFPLSELHRYIRHFAFIKGERTVKLHPEDPANEEAYARMSQLHRALEAGGFTGSDLEKLLVRILFCLFAEDTGVFEPNAFSTFIREKTGEDGGDLGARLNELFQYLNTPRENWAAASIETFDGFKYVNGQLFGDRLGFASFNREMRDALLAAADFQWARVSPAVFGSLFQGIMEDKTRRQQGAHYTSERDIMKVIRSLFLDDLRAEFEARRADRSTGRLARLETFHDKLRSLRFLDPACGCGNFLVLSYRELRLLELDVLRELHSSGQRFLDVRELIKVDVDQFFGIELGEWPVRIAEVALWLMDHQMNLRVSEAFGQTFERLPLRSTPHIVQGNALRLDWREVLPPAEGVYVLGNPPFVGKKEQNAEQKADMAQIWSGVRGAGILDYVTCWYCKAAEYIAGTSITAAFVSTNSITQGEQVGILWGELFRRWGIKIHFGHRTFPWTSEARGKAHVHVVIIGFGTEEKANKRIYEYDTDDGHVTMSNVANISPYLVAAGDTTVQTRTKPIGDAPPINYGSMMIDKDRNDGDEAGLILTKEHKEALLRETPALGPYVRVLYGGEEFLNGTERWCVWLVDAPPELLRASPLLRARIDGVRRFREGSTRPQTRELALTPTLFGEIRQPKTQYLIIPKVSSENRKYIPIGFLSPDIIASGSSLVVADATVYHFGILSSAMHNAWMRCVAGRLESRYQYSNNIVYNNFPWPADVTAKRKGAVEAAAQAVLDARAPYLPPKGKSTLADLYDPLTMPAPLAKAHSELDRAVDRCYRREPFRSDRERVEHLFALYEALTSPLLPAEPKRAKRARRAPRC